MRRILPALAIFASACGSQDEPTPQQIDTAIANAKQEAKVAEAQALPAPAPAAVASPIPAATIPAAMIGRWGLVANDCDPTRTDAKGLMTIGLGELRFYESRAVPRNSQAVGESEWTTELDYTGEGQTWTERTTFTVKDGGRTLVRRADGAWTYQRCPDVG